ncbi:hypothetical protein HMPREF9104_02380 [Lentilactobacillus kisonensis F0435]|uniref:Uncharacterized protein n=1 Tax=Lentilactobacillus kisonensis F0435 TaxID=797516 RepID=H1LID9_9LACO|nr:hypothetical protein HMPREF9104_02380 [Lentilactobacillus kisonensis F0435]
MNPKSLDPCNFNLYPGFGFTVVVLISRLLLGVALFHYVTENYRKVHKFSQPEILGLDFELRIPKIILHL